jgi:hypothetical protein
MENSRYERFRTWSYVLYVVGWSLGLWGRLYGVGELAGDD